MTSFKNKVIVVTGAASGIGLAICERFAKAGAALGLLDMDAERLKAAEKKLCDGGVRCLSVPCDVSSRDACNTAIGQILDHFGGIDVLVNNAGITQRSAFVDTDIAVFEKVMAVNFFGSLYCTKAAIHSLIERKGLIIVNESIAGIAPLLGRTGYSASKHALHGLFTSLRTEIRETGAHVMVVCPGFVETHLQTRALGADGRVTQRPQSRVGGQQTPEKVADIIYRGALRRKDLLVLTPVGKLTWWMSRLLPPLYERIMAKQLKSELDE
ncbi:MAG: SDR family oxidoreductase [Deltaproteobacteria bacterium]|jgi:NAD(P)-dependent dehydrogenase (short-subunit alcohol dehydrogenase family)|nr:SDR family oxidoreductase [Deltaproteobacteria bacterium]